MKIKDLTPLGLFVGKLSRELPDRHSPPIFARKLATHGKRPNKSSPEPCQPFAIGAMGFVRQNTETDAPTSRVSPTGPRLMRSDEGCQRIACNIKNMKQKGTNWLCSYRSIPTRRNAQSRTITHNPPNLNRLCYDTSMNPASSRAAR